MSDFAATLRAILHGEKTDSDIQSFLEALNEDGLNSEHVRIGVEIMRENMTPVDIPGAIDIVGTGGTGLHTLSVSTATALVCAGAGAKVAKHGNRAASSLTGTADTLSVLGVNLAITPEKAAQCVREAGIGFLFAPNHHPAMRFVGPARKALGRRTIFNLLGPMSNPASTQHMLVGVNNDKWRHLMANAFANLGAKHIWVVHGVDGLDEITTTAPTFVSEVKDGKVTQFTLTPEAFGLKRDSIEALRGGHPADNAKALRGLLNGKASAYRDIVLLNSGAAMMIAGKTKDIQSGIALAAKSIDNGKAKAALAKLVEVSNG